MKKALFLVFALAGIAAASCIGPFCWDESGSSVSSGFAIPVLPAAVSTITPARTGQLAQDSSNLVYISTSTNRGGWQKVGAQ